MQYAHKWARYAFVLSLMTSTTTTSTIAAAGASHAANPEYRSFHTTAADATAVPVPGDALELLYRSDKHVEIAVDPLQILGAAFFLNFVLFNTLVTSGGPYPITGVFLTLTLPTILAIQSLTPPDGWTCGDPEQTGDVQVITCEPDDGMLAAETEATVRVEVQATETGTYTVSAEGEANEFDPNVANNSASVELTIEGPDEPEILYVDRDASGANDGSSWTDAFTGLEAALDAAGPDDEIWVAEGAYTAASSPFRILTDGVRLYGGFDGTETAREERDFESNVTVLSGDVDQNDEPFDPLVDSDGDENTPMRTDHIRGSNNLVLLVDARSGNPITSATMLDGFTITSGRGTYAGGLYCQAYAGGQMNNICSPTLANLVFEGNHASRGGAIYNSGEFGNESSPTLTNVTFNGNYADEGGAIYNAGRGGVSSPSIAGSGFINNAADNGGAIYNDAASSGTSSPQITDSHFTNNTAAQSGGAVYNDGTNDGASSPTISNTEFSGNAALAGDGGAIYNGESSPALTEVTFTENSAGGSGGAVYNSGSGGVIAGKVFAANSAAKNSAGNSGGAVHNSVDGGTITGAVFVDNTAEGFGGALVNDGRNGASSPEISRVDFIGNTAGESGGAVYNNGSGSGSNPAFTNVRFIGNTADGFGGGAVYNFCQSSVSGEVSPHFTNVVFTGNVSTLVSTGAINGGGAILNEIEDTCTGSPRITNVTFAGNSAAASGGAILNDGALVETGDGGILSPTIANSILFGNTAGGEGSQIYNTGHVINSDGIELTISYSIIEGGIEGISENDGSTTIDGGGNMDEDPLFVDADGADDDPGTEDDDLRLQVASAAIDAGDNSATPSGVTDDLDGVARFFDVPGAPDTGSGTAPIVDLGAYEFGGAPLATDHNDGPPEHFALHPSYPNPFNPSAIIPFDVTAPSHVVLKVFDTLGRVVTTLADRNFAPGRHEVVFRSRDLPSGVYFYSLEIGAFHAVRKMVLLR